MSDVMTWPERVDTLVACACINKRSYRNAAVAWAARDRIMTSERATNRDQIEGTRPYRCDFGGLVHLGHPRAAP